MAQVWLKNTLLVVFVAVTLGAVARWILLPPQPPGPTQFYQGFYQQHDVQATINRVDSEFSSAWKSKGIEPASQADNLLIARRLSLGLMGTVPSLEELRQFQAQPQDQQVNWWLSRILEDRRFHDYVAERFARAFVGTENGPFIIYRRRRFVSWLSDHLEENTPYDEIVREMLTDEGLWTNSPAVNFVTVTTDQNGTEHPDPIRLAGRTTRAMLGLRIDCLQCHDDFLGSINLGEPEEMTGGTQQDFHSLAAFYSEVRNSLGGVRDKKGMDPYQYKFLDEDDETKVDPTVPFSQNLLPASGTRREKLAGWVTHPKNRQFARATVNRVWAIMCGKPLVEPVDSIPLFMPMPPGMDALVDDFIDNGFDIKRLVRIIAMTRVYRLDSSAQFEITKEHDRNWAVFPRTRLRPEQVAGSIIQATALTTIDSTEHALVRLIRFGQENDFVQRYGDLGENEFDESSETVSQRLLLMNGELIQERIAAGMNAPGRVASFSPDDKTAIEAAFLTTLTRKPAPEETGYFLRRINEAPSRAEAIEDMYWVLMNLDEFGFNH